VTQMVLASTILKRLTQSLYFKTCAKQREQACHQYCSTLRHQENVGLRAQFGKMPENHDRRPKNRRM
jgi:hypothetical protein